jgi:hypothetical protein
MLKTECEVHILASTSVPFTLTTVHVPNWALTHKKRITVCGRTPTDNHLELHKIHWPIRSILSPIATSVRVTARFDLFHGRGAIHKGPVWGARTKTWPLVMLRLSKLCSRRKNMEIISYYILVASPLYPAVTSLQYYYMLMIRSLRRKELRPIQPEIIKRRLICDLFERSSLPTSTQQQGLARSRYGGVIKILNSKCTFDIDEAIKGILQSAVATGSNVHTRAVRLRLIYSLKTF